MKGQRGQRTLPVLVLKSLATPTQTYPLPLNHPPSIPTWLVGVLVHGVDEGERGDADEEDDDGGEEGPDDFQRGVVGQLLSEGA